MKTTSGGPDLRDCMAHPSSWSSRSEKLGEAAAVAEVTLSLSDMLAVSDVRWWSSEEGSEWGWKPISAV